MNSIMYHREFSKTGPARLVADPRLCDFKPVAVAPGASLRPFAHVAGNGTAIVRIGRRLVVRERRTDHD